MWDKNKPLKLADALCYDAYIMQHIIEVDKYVACEQLGYDLCGNYAPFCSVCEKWVPNPCSTAYRISERMAFICPFLDSTGADDARVVQAVADVDKYLASEGLGVDLCGRYAPFCAVCDKSQPFPCGQAYLRLKTAENFSTKALVAQEGGELIINVPRWDEALTQVLEADGTEKNEIVAEDNETKESKPRSFRIGVARRRVNDI